MKNMQEDTESKSGTPGVLSSEDVHCLDQGDREIILVGTAHISKESARLVKEVIAETRPDCVCVELDERRFKALADRRGFAALDLKEIVRKRQLSTLLVNLILSSYQRKLGSKLGVVPGLEMLEAIRSAEDLGIPVALCDRDVRVTMRRAWHATSLFKKAYLLATLLASLFDRTELTEEKLAELKKKDMLSELMAELGEALPDLKRVLIDERDIYLSEKIKAAAGKRLVAVVGAGHIEGIKKALERDYRSRLPEISTFPPVSAQLKAVGWAIPVIIIGSLFVIGWQKGAAVAGANLLYWILVNGIPASVGAMLAMAHPATIIGAFIAAPITSLTPVIGAGYVCAFIQIMVCPPQVMEFETALDDMGSVRGWWRNKLLRVLLTFLLPGFGSLIGTWVGGYEIISNLMSM